MFNKEQLRDIYLMGIGGTGMGAFAGLLKKSGHHVSGSDNAVYSPMKEKLDEWNISYTTPYKSENLQKRPDLVIVGNVIRKDNPEAQALREASIAYESFPSALNKFFLTQSIPLVASGTHGKTTCSALLAHCLYQAGRDPGFLIGGIPINFGESFRVSSKKQHYPFVVEGDEYDTAYFDKRPKFIHYNPHYLLITSIEYDHADIYPDLESIIDAFSKLLKTLNQDRTIVYNVADKNIHAALKCSQTKAKLVSYGAGADYQAVESIFDEKGMSFKVGSLKGVSPVLSIPLYGKHNLSNALGCYTMLKEYGLEHDEIAQGFSSFKGVKRRMEEIFDQKKIIAIDDFAHHPSAVKETIWATQQKYPQKKIWAIFEPRSATSCSKIFESAYQEAFLACDKAIFAPVGRDLPADKKIDTLLIAQSLNNRGVQAHACTDYEQVQKEIKCASDDVVLLFMSNGAFGGILNKLPHIFS
ncbi:MAG: UDP-N-acetylmuramate dehydrogenase [Myxococcales bacterium]|nr:UDP-N-acetylmuramate dehydrogenase [Myxococcales bacterium]USN51884.1 MAG: UDP-N-acetylmuramate dehydrogenase [Myxococcales bacterium]